jgi:TonB family protein
MKLFCILLAITAIFISAVEAQKQDGTPQPTLISAPQPVYPKEAKDALIGGRVVVRVVVDESGAIVSVGEATGPAQLCGSGADDPRLKALREAVVEAIKQAKFSAAMKDGKPVKSAAFVSSTFDPFDGTGASAGKRMINSGVVNGKAVSLPKPEYPLAARAERASGAVSIKVVVDENGGVFTAEPVSGHPLLRSAAVRAACRAKFTPTFLDGKVMRVAGIITYNFVP